ncbi:TPA: cellulose biosynthesis protein BcsF, partial [Escherichia albertii]|nr:cellulose biosynthesis protein BcsF [Escherichia albertii]HEB1076118.1 cellulose biosynthesis protein BcsF [Escherichia albertii]HEB1080413.1 cellulose biosynthesis protein BcsF [Escherichia albertii]HEB1143188.1 cellulose biosynthesis protein BcsF [Escherichia albertii]HEB1181553.1 cellulose biosynthesis protein BcsF [Escherichia albertii]
RYVKPVGTLRRAKKARATQK